MWTAQMFSAIFGRVNSETLLAWGTKGWGTCTYTTISSKVQSSGVLKSSLLACVIFDSMEIFVHQESMFHLSISAVQSSLHPLAKDAEPRSKGVQRKSTRLHSSTFNKCMFPFFPPLRVLSISSLSSHPPIKLRLNVFPVAPLLNQIIPVPRQSLSHEKDFILRLESESVSNFKVWVSSLV